MTKAQKIKKMLAFLNQNYIAAATETAIIKANLDSEGRLVTYHYNKPSYEEDISEYLLDCIYDQLFIKVKDKFLESQVHNHLFVD